MSYERHKQRHTAEFRVRFKSYDEFFTQYTENISQGGMFIRTSKVREVNTVIRLWVMLPGQDEEVEVLARVAHVRTPEAAEAAGSSPGMGLEFLEMGFEAKQALNDYFLGGLGGAEEKAPEPKPEPTVPKRILGSVLIVEDDGLLQKKISKLLQSKGLKVRVAGNGVEGIGMCVKQKPDLILSDIEMPTMDGWGLLRMVKARAELKEIPFVFLSSAASERNRLKGYQQGVDDFIAKSTPPKEIIARIDRILSRVSNPSRDSVMGWGLGGDLQQVSLPTLLQMLELERKTGVLEVVGEEGAITVSFRYGQPVAAELMPGDLSGTDAIYRLLDWDAGRFKFRLMDVTVADEIDVPISGLLMEHARLRDEAAR